MRVWFGASVHVSRLLPTFIVDYAAGRALKRATNWVRPAVAAAPLTLMSAAEAEELQGAGTPFATAAAAERAARRAAEERAIAQGAAAAAAAGWIAAAPAADSE